MPESVAGGPLEIPDVRSMLSAALLLLGLAATGFAQPMAAPGWRNAAGPAGGSVPAEGLSDLARDGERHFVVRFAGRVSAGDRDALATAGVRVLDPLGENAYFVGLTANVTPPMPVALAEARIERIRTAQKLHPLLATNPADLLAWHRRGLPGLQAQVPLYVACHRDVQVDHALRARLEALGARVRRQLRSLPVLVVEAPLDRIADLAAVDAVQWIEPAAPPLDATNDQSRTASGVEALQAVEGHLDGSGVTAFIFDSGLGLAQHPDFGGRLTAIDDAGAVVHSTHVAATVGGNGVLSDGRYRGMAPNVTLVSAGLTIDPNEIFFYLDPADIEADYDLAINAFGADVANNSLGTNTESSGFPCEIQGDYGVAAALYDGIVRGSLGRPLVVVFAAGNERASARCDVEGFGDYYSTSPPAGNKNTITVGALNANNDSLTTFSSWGPTDDGRIRPDVCAPGCQSNDDLGVTSAVLGNTYGTLCGTSMSSPVVTGLLSLLIQEGRLLRPTEADPLPATQRALLAHTARDLEQIGPDYRSGYGAVQAEAALAALRSGNWTEGRVTDRTVRRMFVEVAAGGGPLKLTLAWDDPPGAFNVVPNLVNDLDLRVIGPDGTRHWPWNLDPLRPDAPAVQVQADRVNNMEQVLVAAPAAGVYRIEVVGWSIPEGGQRFGLHSTLPLLTCPPRAVPGFVDDAYDCGDEVVVEVTDCAAGGGPLAAMVSSDSDPAGRVVALAADPNRACYRGSLQLDESGQNGLAVSDGDTLTIRYEDAASGLEQTAVSRVQCGPLTIDAVEVLTIEPTRATVRVTTSRAARVLIEYAATCGGAGLQAVGTLLAGTHDVVLRDLGPGTTTRFRVRAETESGQGAVADNGGGCFAVTTPPSTRHYAEEFLFDFDLRDRQVRFTPDGAGGYTACTVPIGSLPVAPGGGVPLSIPNGGFVSIPLADGKLVTLYERAYDRVIVGTDGYVSLGQGTVVPGGFEGHYAIPRVSALMTALDPNSGGSIRWEQLDDRVAVTWQRVPTLGQPTALNTFQIGLLFNGEVELSYRRTEAFYGITGISAGGGKPIDLVPVDFSALLGCSTPPLPLALAYARTALQGQAVTVPLNALDEPNRVPTFTLRSLPTQPLRWNATGGLLSTADLPIRFPPGPVGLTYEPDPARVGSEAWSYEVENDLGATSSPAEVRVTLLATRGLPFRDGFESGVLDPNRWEEVAGATISALADGPPSGLRALRLNGDPAQGDRIESTRLDLAGAGPVLLEYEWQAGGRGAAPGPLARFAIEGRMDSGSWQTLLEYDGDGEATAFVRDQVYLPDAALHAGFQLRFVSRGDLGPFDDWFVDDVRVRASTEPLALRDRVSTHRATMAEIELSGVDPRDKPLSYVITSLPRRGTLNDPGGGQIATVPYTLREGGNIVRYFPAPRTLGEDGFAFATDNGAQRSVPAAMEVTIDNRVVLHDFPLDTDPGWQREAGWAFGPLPSGTGSTDPNAAHTGENVFGYALGGDYPPGLTEPRYLTTGVLPLRGRSAPLVQFHRWLHKDFNDEVTLEVSTDGVIWDLVWPLRDNLVVADEEWKLERHDLRGFVGADDDQVQVRWGLGPTNQVVQLGGWNLDDIQLWVTDLPCPADLSGNGRIDELDLVILLRHFGALDALGPEYGDLDEDGVIDLRDLAELLAAYGGECP